MEGDRFKAALEGQLGMEIVLDSSVGWDRRQFRFPRSKKKRVRKKWAGQSKNYKVVDTGDAFVENGRLVMGHHTLHNLMVDVLGGRLKQWSERIKA